MKAFTTDSLNVIRNPWEELQKNGIELHWNYQSLNPLLLNRNEEPKELDTLAEADVDQEGSNDATNSNEDNDIGDSE